EPFTNLLTQGMVKLNGETMSKSKGNVVAPETVIGQYGADTMRTYIMFMAPPEKDLEWEEEGVAGAHRWLKRVWTLAAHCAEDAASYSEDAASCETEAARTLIHEAHRLTKKVTVDIEDFQFNTAIAGLMELTNALYAYSNATEPAQRSRAVYTDALKRLVLMLAPIAPHITEEMWQTLLGHDESVHNQAWPDYDEALTVTDTIELPVQINGKVRARITVASDADEARVEAAAREAVLGALEGREIKRLIVVPGRIVTIVV
ncbi:MAG: class I tRNA ligase family protein, partial [Actinomycetia bacterium]|nr:class I tRNA ligase family protein [Actinomycetes bacterium]